MNPSEKTTTKASIIIPTFNRLGRLKAVIGALEEQTEPLNEFEVIVISDGSSDGTDEYLQGYTQPLHLKAQFQTNKGPAAARNLGIAEAVGEIVIFIDDDVVPAPELVREHLQTHEVDHGDNQVVLGPMLTPLDTKLSPWTQWEQEMLMKQYSAMDAGDWLPTARQFYTGNSSIARRHLVASGGFDASLRRAEDVELAYRLELAGLRFIYQPRAIGYHYPLRSYRSWTQIAYDYGRNDVLFHQLKGHDWVLPIMAWEFKKRHLWTRILVWVCLDRRLLATLPNTFIKASSTSVLVYRSRCFLKKLAVRSSICATIRVSRTI